MGAILYHPQVPENINQYGPTSTNGTSMQSSHLPCPSRSQAPSAQTSRTFTMSGPRRCWWSWIRNMPCEWSKISNLITLLYLIISYYCIVWLTVVTLLVKLAIHNGLQNISKYDTKSLVGVFHIWFSILGMDACSDNQQKSFGSLCREG